LRELQKQLGDVFCIRVLSHPPVVVMADPEHVREVFSGSPDDLYSGQSSRLIESVVGKNSLLLLDGPRHLRERRLLLPPFHGERMWAYGEVMREISERTIAGWPKNTPFAVQPQMGGITLDVILRTVFGVADAERLSHLRRLIVQLTGNADSPLFFAAMLAMPGDRLRRILTFGMEDGAPSWKRALSKLLPMRLAAEARMAIDSIVLSEIRHRREHGTSGRSDVLSLLVDARHEDGTPMHDQELLDEMITLLLAGHETSAVTLGELGFAPGFTRRHAGLGGAAGTGAAGGADQAARRGAGGDWRRAAPAQGHQPPALHRGGDSRDDAHRHPAAARGSRAAARHDLRGV
jgi:cytochrome P450